MNIDFAPTFLSLAGIKEPGKFDGKSLHPLLTANKTDPKFRNNFLIEHSGEFHEEVKNCPQYKNQGMSVSITNYPSFGSLSSVINDIGFTSTE